MSTARYYFILLVVGIKTAKHKQEEVYSVYFICRSLWIVFGSQLEAHYQVLNFCILIISAVVTVLLAVFLYRLVLGQTREAKLTLWRLQSRLGDKPRYFHVFSPKRDGTVLKNIYSSNSNVQFSTKLCESFRPRTQPELRLNVPWLNFRRFRLSRNMELLKLNIYVK